MSTLFNMALNLLLLLHQEFEAAFQEVTKNVVLLILCGNFAWFLGGELFVGRTVSAEYWSSCPLICRDCVFLFLFDLIYLFILFIYSFFRRGFSLRGLDEVSWGILRGVISKHIILLFFFVIFELALSRWNF